MKKLFGIVAIVLFVMVVGIAHASQFGPQEPIAKDGNFSMSAGYTYYTGKWEGGGDNYKMTQNQAFIQGSFTFKKLWEAYARVGGANMKIDDLFVAGENFQDKTQFFGTAGLKGLLYNTPAFGIGPFLQASYFGNYKDSRNVTSGGTSGTWDLKWKNQWDVTFGIGMQTKLNGIILYGGPFVYWAQASLDSSSAVNNIPNRSYTFNEKNNIGGYLGLRIPATKNISVDVEGEVKNNVTGGIKVNYAF